MICLFKNLHVEIYIKKMCVKIANIYENIVCKTIIDFNFYFSIIKHYLVYKKKLFRPNKRLIMDQFTNILFQCFVPRQKGKFQLEIAMSPLQIIRF